MSSPISTLSSNRAGSPTTHTAPSTVPTTELSPPITAMEITRSDSVAEKRAGSKVTRRPPSRPPASPAMAPPMANAVSFTRAGEMPNEAAARSLSRTAIIERPSDDRRTHDTPTSTTISVARQTR